MGNFRTDDDFTGYDGNNANSGEYPDYSGYDKPEMGNGPGEYGKIKKTNIFSRVLSAIGSIVAVLGSGKGNGVSAEKVLLILYVIAMIFIVINIHEVLDFLFYTTMSLLQYVIILLVFLAMGYILFRHILR